MRWQIQSAVSNNSPKEKTLRTSSFIIHATRGMVRDQTTRRRIMFILLLVALALLFSGMTFLQTTLNPRARPVWFILFWVVCGWLTLTALLLAVFDLLMVKLESRKEQRLLRQTLDTNSPGPTIHE
jgi:predicted membrane protein